jgi:hypothetical protein
LPFAFCLLPFAFCLLPLSIWYADSELSYFYQGISPATLSLSERSFGMSRVNYCQLARPFSLENRDCCGRINHFAAEQLFSHRIRMYIWEQNNCPSSECTYRLCGGFKSSK